MPRQITAQCGSSMVPRDHLVFEFLKCILGKFKQRALHILRSTGMRTFFVVLNSKQATQLLPTTAATLESFDFVQFFDKIKHHNIHSYHDHHTPPAPSERLFTFSWNGTPLNYYHTTIPSSLINESSATAGCSDRIVSTALDDIDIHNDEQNAMNQWSASNFALTTSDRIERPATSNTALKNPVLNRLQRIMLHARGITPFLHSTAKLQAARDSATTIAYQAVYDAACAAEHAQSSVTNLERAAANYSGSLVAQHAAAAAYILAQAATAAASPSLASFQKYFLSLTSVLNFTSSST